MVRTGAWLDVAKVRPVRSLMIWGVLFRMHEGVELNIMCRHPYWCNLITIEFWNRCSLLSTDLWRRRNQPQFPSLVTHTLHVPRVRVLALGF